ncbi:MAG TPA: hypothetical protein VFE54_13810, partial [Mucilaginibacter sp.]|nr:hypothetical protein [Mucilaginibacter sp.]
YVQDKNVNAGRIQLFNNWSPFMVPQPDTVWIGVEYFCNETDAFWRQDDSLVAGQAIREMQSIGIIDAENLLDHVVVRVKKAYPSYYGTYAAFDEVRRFLDQIDNLYLVGRNGMHRYNNSDHSMLTAMTAVENIITARSDKSNIWDINTEEAYHEETEMDV